MAEGPARARHPCRRSALRSRVHAKPLLTETGVADPASLPAPPAGWDERTSAVDDELRRRFGNAPALITALEQSRRIGQLLHSGELVSQLIRLRRAA
jgi:hypothetical protein